MGKFSTEVQLSREMSVFDVTLIGVGAMIGAGIFVLTGIAAGVAGPALIVTFALNALVALLTAMSYAELGSCFHGAGGGYIWVREVLPSWNGFLSGWMDWFAHAVACSLYALGFAAYFEHVLLEIGVTLPEVGFLSTKQLLAATVAALFAYINFRGASETGKVGNMVTVGKIVILLVFIGLGLEVIFSKSGWQAAFTPFAPHGWSGIFKAMGLTFIAFQGFEVIAQCAEEVENPRKNIPRAVFFSLLIVVPIYLLVAIVSLGAVDPGDMTSWDYLASKKEIALVEVAKTFFTGGGIMLLVGGLISTMSALNATIYSSSRVAYAMGKDRNFPSFFGKVHPRRFTPHVSIVFSLVIVVLIAVSLPIEDVAAAADIMFLLLFLQVNVALIRMRKLRPDLDRGFFVPLFPYLTIAGILLLLFLALYMFNYSVIAWIVAGFWIIAGVLIYYSYSSKRELEHVKKTRALSRLERKEYRILLPVSRSTPMESLCRIAVAVAQRNNAEVVVLHVVEVEPGQPLRAGLKVEDEVAELVERGRDLVAAEGVRARAIVKVAHRISRGIVETADVEECNFILVGRPKRPTMMERLLSSIIDRVVKRAHCEVAVVHGDLPPAGVRRIVLPYGGGVHTQLAVELSPALAQRFHCEVEIVSVLGRGASQEEYERIHAEISSLAMASGLAARVRLLRDDNTLMALLGVVGPQDLIVMGGRTGEPLEYMFGRSLGQQITEAAPCAVVWVAEYEERQPFWSGLLRQRRLEGVTSLG
jgi:amino acid transporter/nucleotide-binding universal stress UspA family protein